MMKEEEEQEVDSKTFQARIARVGLKVSRRNCARCGSGVGDDRILHRRRELEEEGARGGVGVALLSLSRPRYFCSSCVLLQWSSVPSPKGGDDEADAEAEAAEEEEEQQQEQEEGEGPRPPPELKKKKPRTDFQTLGGVQFSQETVDAARVISLLASKEAKEAKEKAIASASASSKASLRAKAALDSVFQLFREHTRLKGDFLTTPLTIGATNPPQPRVRRKPTSQQRRKNPVLERSIHPTKIINSPEVIPLPPLRAISSTLLNPPEKLVSERRMDPVSEHGTHPIMNYPALPLPSEKAVLERKTEPVSEHSVNPMMHYPALVPPSEKPVLERRTDPISEHSMHPITNSSELNHPVGTVCSTLPLPSEKPVSERTTDPDSERQTDPKSEHSTAHPMMNSSKLNHPVAAGRSTIPPPSEKPISERRKDPLSEHRVLPMANCPALLPPSEKPVLDGRMDPVSEHMTLPMDNSLELTHSVKASSTILPPSEKPLSERRKEPILEQRVLLMAKDPALLPPSEKPISQRRKDRISEHRVHPTADSSKLTHPIGASSTLLLSSEKSILERRKEPILEHRMLPTVNDPVVLPPSEKPISESRKEPVSEHRAHPMLNCPTPLNSHEPVNAQSILKIQNLAPIDQRVDHRKDRLGPLGIELKMTNNLGSLPSIDSCEHSKQVADRPDSVVADAEKYLGNQSKEKPGSPNSCLGNSGACHSNNITKEEGGKCGPILLNLDEMTKPGKSKDIVKEERESDMFSLDPLISHSLVSLNAARDITFDYSLKIATSKIWESMTSASWKSPTPVHNPHSGSIVYLDDSSNSKLGAEESMAVNSSLPKKQA